MATRLTLTLDCQDATAQALFWAAALDYELNPPPTGWSSWEAWLDDHDVPEHERGSVARIAPPADQDGPSISFLEVPEAKTAKNRLHPDLQVSGGRHVDAAERRSLVESKVEQLLGLGATVLHRDETDGVLDHVVLADPEGNELCVV